MNMETTNNTTPRIRIEDMTLGKIKAARLRLESKIGEAIEREIDAFREVYDWGHLAVQVDTDIEYPCFDTDKRSCPVARITRTINVKSDAIEDI